ncbi:MAG: family 16 glycosylhydrolase, partial [Bacteroidetes bacterium]|nr:family 16 glycosylhydrolase [Bacteroidota bacterium]
MSPFNTKEYPYLFLFLLFFIFAGCDEENNKENEIDRFTVQSATFSEGNSNTIAEIRVTLEGSLVSDVTVPFEFEEITALIGDDFNPTGGELTFSPDNLEASVPVEIVGDEHFEITESFTLQLTANGQPTNFRITITDNDEMAEILSDEDGFYTPEEYPSMSLKWSDEFDGDQLNTGDWTYELGNGCNQGICGWGNNELEDYTDSEENSSVENGMLTITARKEGGDYTSARIKTENKVELQYGRIDIRAKLPKGQGIWPAI